MKNYIQYLDLGYMPNPTFIKGNHVYRSPYCGYISLVALILFLLYFMGKMLIMFASYDIDMVRKKGSSDFYVKGLEMTLWVDLVDTDSGQQLQITNDNMY